MKNAWQNLFCTVPQNQTVLFSLLTTILGKEDQQCHCTMIRNPTLRTLHDEQSSLYKIKCNYNKLSVKKISGNKSYRITCMGVLYI